MLPWQYALAASCGLFIAAGGNNLVLNCDSHDNYDPDARGENAAVYGLALGEYLALTIESPDTYGY